MLPDPVVPFLDLGHLVPAVQGDAVGTDGGRERLARVGGTVVPVLVFDLTGVPGAVHVPRAGYVPGLSMCLGLSMCWELSMCWGLGMRLMLVRSAHLK